MSKLLAYMAPTEGQTFESYLDRLWPLDVINSEIRESNLRCRSTCLAINILVDLGDGQSKDTPINERAAYMYYAIYNMYMRGICAHANLLGYPVFDTPDQLHFHAVACASITVAEMDRTFRTRLFELFPDDHVWCVLSTAGVSMFGDIARHLRETDTQLIQNVSAHIREKYNTDKPDWLKPGNDSSDVARCVQTETKAYTVADIDAAIDKYVAVHKNI